MTWNDKAWSKQILACDQLGFDWPTTIKSNQPSYVQEEIYEFSSSCVAKVSHPLMIFPFLEITNALLGTEKWGGFSLRLWAPLKDHLRWVSRSYIGPFLGRLPQYAFASITRWDQYPAFSITFHLKCFRATINCDNIFRWWFLCLQCYGRLPSDHNATHQTIFLIKNELTTFPSKGNYISTFRQNDVQFHQVRFDFWQPATQRP